MTEEQFKQLMDKLDAILRSQPGLAQPNPYLPAPQYPQPQPWDHRHNDLLPWHWPHGGARD